MLTQKILKELLYYDPETGNFTWLRRPERAAQDRMWNGRWAGKVSGNIRPDGYIRIGLSGKLYLAHRLVWLYVYGRWPDEQIDHSNQDRSDNRITNLREVSHQGNCRNHPLRIDNTSGVTGVCWEIREGKWRARISLDGRKCFLGYFDDFEKAVKARKAAEIQHGFHKNHGNPRKAA